MAVNNWGKDKNNRKPGKNGEEKPWAEKVRKKQEDRRTEGEKLADFLIALPEEARNTIQQSKASVEGIKLQLKLGNPAIWSGVLHTLYIDHATNSLTGPGTLGLVALTFMYISKETENLVNYKENSEKFNKQLHSLLESKENIESSAENLKKYKDSYSEKDLDKRTKEIRKELDKVNKGIKKLTDIEDKKLEGVTQAFGEGLNEKILGRLVKKGLTLEEAGKVMKAYKSSKLGNPVLDKVLDILENEHKTVNLLRKEMGTDFISHLGKKLSKTLGGGGHER